VSMITIKLVYVVRKHILEPGTGRELRYEDYAEEFDSEEKAQVFMKQKRRKFAESLEAMLNDGAKPETIEGRRFEIVPK